MLADAGARRRGRPRRQELGHDRDAPTVDRACGRDHREVGVEGDPRGDVDASRHPATAPARSAPASSSPPTTTALHVDAGVVGGEVGQRELHAATVARGTGGDRATPSPARWRRPRARCRCGSCRRPTTSSKIWVCSATMRPGPRVDVRGDARLAQHGVLHRDGDARPARHDERLQRRRLLHAGVGDERDVDDGVVAERVEQQQVLLAAVDASCPTRSTSRWRRCGCTTRPRRRRRARATCDTAAGPPTVSTTTPGSAVASTSATGTLTSSPGARRMVSVAGAASPPGITVMVASMSVCARLAMTTVSVASPSGVDVPAAQYHALDATSAAGTPMLGARGRGRRASTRSSRTTRPAAPRPRPPARRTTTNRIGPRRTRRGRGVARRREPARRESASGAVGSRVVGAHTRSHQNASSSSSASGSGFAVALPTPARRRPRGSTDRVGPACGATARSRAAR